MPCCGKCKICRPEWDDLVAQRDALQARIDDLQSQYDTLYANTVRENKISLATAYLSAETAVKERMLSDEAVERASAGRTEYMRALRWANIVTADSPDEYITCFIREGMRAAIKAAMGDVTT